MSDNYNDNDLYSSDSNMYDSSREQEHLHDQSDQTTRSYEYTSENNSKPKKKKRDIFLKVAVIVLPLAIGIAAGIQVYKFLSETKAELVEYSGDTSKSASKTADKDDDDSEKKASPSLIELASRSDAKLIPDIVDSIMPSVVGVASTFEFQPTQTFSFFGWNSQPQTQQLRVTGTGFIITKDGYIVTNAHVVYDEEYNAGKATDVSVLFSDETEHEASIVAYDTETDIAVLKVDETGLKPAELGNSDELRVGELVIAVGNPLGFDLFGTVTSGIVSALNRKIDINEKNMNLIQTDAAINNGNSGGPLLNSCGQVIGINSAKMSSSYSNSASVEGLCFAIPIKEAKDIIDDLINYRYVTGRPQMGINSTDISEAMSRYWDIPVGVYVRFVKEGSAADLAGVKVGDVIIDIEGEAVSTAKELNEVINKYKAGDTITITVSRSDEDIRIKLTLQEKKSEVENSTIPFDDNAKISEY